MGWSVFGSMISLGYVWTILGSFCLWNIERNSNQLLYFFVVLCVWIYFILIYLVYFKHYDQFAHYGSSSLEAQGVAHKGLKARPKHFALEATKIATEMQMHLMSIQYTYGEGNFCCSFLGFSAFSMFLHLPYLCALLELQNSDSIWRVLWLLPSELTPSLADEVMHIYSSSSMMPYVDWFWLIDGCLVLVLVLVLIEYMTL